MSVKFYTGRTLTKQFVFSSEILTSYFTSYEMKSVILMTGDIILIYVAKTYAADATVSTTVYLPFLSLRLIFFVNRKPTTIVAAFGEEKWRKEERQLA